MGVFSGFPRDIIVHIARKYLYESVSDRRWKLRWNSTNEHTQNVIRQRQLVGKLGFLSRNKRLNSQKITQIRSDINDLKKRRIELEMEIEALRST